MGRKKLTNERFQIRSHPKVIQDVRKYAKEKSEEFINNDRSQEGMTLRDYFASSAMQGLMSMEDKGTSGSLQEMADKVASFSYEIADAMLRQREL